MCSKARLRGTISSALLVTLFAGLGIVGCGKKGDPLPPLRDVPATTNDLSLSQQGRLIMLEMTYPQTTINGMTLGGIDGVELYLLTKPAPEGATTPTAEAQEMEGASRRLLTLRGADLQSSILGDRIQLRLPLQDPLPTERTANIFAVRTLKGDEPSAFSNRTVLVPQEPPTPASSLRADAKARFVELQWQSDVEAQAFDIFRRYATERGYGEPIGRAKGDRLSYKDYGVKYGEQYIYTVRTVVGDETEITSEPAGEVEISYQDRFPPRLPDNFVALPERESVRLRWDAGTDNDLAGYFIFRRNPGQSDFVRLNTEPVQGTEYVDSGLNSGIRFEYQLKAVDTSGNETRRALTASATTR